MLQEKNFGSLLTELRKSREVSLRVTAREIGVSATYLSKVENNNKAPLTAENIEKVSAFLHLNEEEKTALYDFAANWKGISTLPEDCIAYAKEIPSAVEALRVAKNIGLGENEWKKMVEDLKLRSGRN